MAKGVRCSFCKTELEGDIELGDEVDCPQCHRTFKVHSYMLDAYAKENPSAIKKFTAGTFQVLGAIIVLFSILGAILTLSTCSPSKPSSTTSTSTTNSNGTRAGTSEDAKYFSSWNGANDELVAYVKHGMKDPSTFEHIDTRFKDNGSSYSIKMTFKGKNSLNAVVTQTVTADLDKATRKLSNIQEIK